MVSPGAPWRMISCPSVKVSLFAMAVIKTQSFAVRYCSLLLAMGRSFEPVNLPLAVNGQINPLEYARNCELREKPVRRAAANLDPEGLAAPRDPWKAATKKAR